MTDLRIEDVPEDLRDFYAELKHCALRDGASFYAKRCLEYIERIARLEARNAEPEALASKWATDAPLSERRTPHEASVAYNFNLIETNLKKIADHATQLPWAECARLAREALDR